MEKTKICKAIVFALVGPATMAIATSNAQAGQVNYNAFNHDAAAPGTLVGGSLALGSPPGGPGTDGWMRTAANDSYSDGHSWGEGEAAGNMLGVGSEVQWLGTDPRLAVANGGFGYGPTTIGNSTPTLNWTAELLDCCGTPDSVTISRIDSNARYGGTLLADGTTFDYADIDTAQGAWHDGISTGWRHDTDIGLFRSAKTQDVVLTMSSLGPVNMAANYAIYRIRRYER